MVKYMTNRLRGGIKSHLYVFVINCCDTLAYMSSIPSMSHHLDDNIPENVFNIDVNVSIDTKLCTCEICTYKIKHFSRTCHIVCAQRALVVLKMLVIRLFFIRVRKFFIFYNFRKQNACVKADDGRTFESGFI